MPASRTSAHREGRGAASEPGALKWAARWRAAAQNYCSDPRRRAINEETVKDDVTGCVVLGSLWLGMAVKTWLGGEAALALLPASYALHEWSHFALIRRVPAFRAAYVRWRELFFLGILLHVLANIIGLSIWSRGSLLTLHGGSSLRLALMMAAASGSISIGSYYPYCAFLRPFVAATLPLTLLLPLASSRSLCRRLLEDATSHEPLGRLHGILNLVHSATAGPSGWSVFPPTSTSLQPCIQVNVYLIGLLGCALPLLLARRSPPPPRQQAEPPEGAGLAASLLETMTKQHLLARLVLASSLAWSCSVVAALAIGR